MTACPHRLSKIAVPALVLCGIAASLCPLTTMAEESCGSFGTSVDFAESPAAAAQRALEEEKLVFILHVSGNFEVPEYT